nr:hypothetical protein [Pseudo-nitzschia hainanensis]
MRIKEMSYFEPYYESEADIDNACLDVYVTLENNDFYLLEVTTPKYLCSIMEKSKSNFVQPYYPCIIVSELKYDTIRSAIQQFIDEEEDAYWLKLYHTAGVLNIEDINKILLDREEKEQETED